MFESPRILAWVQNIPDNYNHSSRPSSPLASSQGQKRKAATPHQLTSPPPSLSNMDSTPTRKRQRRTDILPSLGDADDTPRPHTGSARSIASVSTSTSLRYSNASSVRSRSESPKKQMMRLRIDDQGLEFRPLNIDSVPEAAADLLRVLEEIGRGLDILPHEWHDRILHGDLSREREARWRYSFKPLDAPDQLPGRIPSFDEVELVGEMAKECLNFGHDQSGWNGEVHHQILKAVFRDPSRKKGGILNFANLSSTTARPHHKYLPRVTSAKMVDSCIYADLCDDENWRQGLQTLSRKTHTVSVNHTDFAPLQLRPIWSFLRSAVSLAVQSRSSPTESTPDPSSSDQTEHAAQVDAALSRLGFIPGIIVQGHRWLFVLSTLEGQKTILWTERQFGSTQSILETYQIVAGLRELGAWARDVYLPWFQHNILTQ
ncbi:hypothetical protein EDB80DRAFT_820232 [Ilyonectria destructans]|nr:hypothetical protein EDB80DRAFT_820232 [Ilyonectria destructans]